LKLIVDEDLEDIHKCPFLISSLASKFIGISFFFHAKEGRVQNN